MKATKRTHDRSGNYNAAEGFFLNRNERNPVVMDPRSSPEAFFPQHSEGEYAEGVVLNIHLYQM